MQDKKRGLGQLFGALGSNHDDHKILKALFSLSNHHFRTFEPLIWDNS
jgi:hypothetical protein